MAAVFVGPVTPMDQALIWIGFTDVAARARVLEELGDDLSNFLRYTETDITSLEKSMAEGLPAANRVRFGFSRTKYLKAMIHWVKDIDRINKTPSLGTMDKDEFLQALCDSEQRAKIRSLIVAGSAARASEASPGKLRDEKQWNAWEQALLTQLNILLGVNGVPLSYVVRETTASPDDVFNTFFEESAAKARLSGPEFEADALQVHQLIRSLTVGENAQQWLTEVKQYNDGRRDMIALRNHFRGEGNNSRNIAQAQHLRATLHYKSEKAMEFSKYLDLVKKMFNIYSECKEPLAEAAKLRFLWDTIKSNELVPAMESIKAALGQDPNSWTFVSAANHLASQIPPPSSGHGRQLSDVHRGDTTNPGGGIYLKDGSIKLYGYQPQVWRQLSAEDQAKVHAARKKHKNGGKNGRKGNGKQAGKSGRGNHNKFQDLTKMVKQQGKMIAALSGKKRVSDASDDDSVNDSGSSSADDAGNSFGGRESKKQQKSAASKKKPKHN